MACKTISNFMKKALALILCVAICLIAAPAGLLHAEEIEETPTPSISVSSTTVEAGSYAYFYVNAADLVNVAGMELSLYYDAEVMTVSWCDTGYLLSNASNSINDDTPGVITLKAMDVYGINGGGQLLSVGFETHADAPAGNYPVTLAIGSVYDTNLVPVTVEKASGYLTLSPSQESATKVRFNSYTDASWVSEGDTFHYYLQGMEPQGLTAGNFVFTYDETLLKVTDIALGTALKTEHAIYSINQEVPGCVKIAYVNIESVTDQYWEQYFDLTFEVIGTPATETSTIIEFSANSLKDETLGNLCADNQSAWVYIQPPAAATPQMWLVDNQDRGEDGVFTIDLLLSENSNVAAGDFVVSYDTSAVVCTAVKVSDAVKSGNAMLIYKEEIGNGQVKFSYITTKPFANQETLLTLTFQANKEAGGNTYMSITGKGVTDLDFQTINLEYPEFIYRLPVDIGDFYGYVQDAYGHTYDGTAKEPSVYLSGLTEGVDYTLTYRNNVNAGYATAIATGKGNYKGTKEMEFYIQQAPLYNHTISMPNDTCAYDGTEQRPQVSIDGLTEGVDYTLQYWNNVYPGSAWVHIEGIGNYYGSTDQYFTITEADIAGKTATLSQSSFIYDGDEKRPQVFVDGLYEHQDYWVQYSNNVNVGTATAYVYGQGYYTGGFPVTFEIAPATLPENEIYIEASTLYDGSAKEPSVGLDRFMQGYDYTVTYKNNVNAGTATVTIQGIGNYTGTYTKTFQITPRTLLAGNISLSETYFTYDGAAKEPMVHVSGLVLDQDYTVTYTNNVNAGTATATIQGIGNYKGTVTKTYQIGTAQLPWSEVTLSQESVLYDGGKKEPVVTIPGLTQGTDFTVTYTNNVNVGTATATIQGIGNYTGSCEKEYQILPAAMADQTAQLSQDCYTYDGTAKEPKVKIDGLTLGTDYTVTYTNQVNAGTATVSIQGLGNYTGTQTREYTILPADLTEKEAVLSQNSFCYDGTAKEPVVSIQGLTLGQDFVVSYENNVEAGTATAIITGKNNYAGTLTLEFEIKLYELGDVNDDGKINVRDVMKLKEYLADPQKVTINLLAADLDGNGKLNVRDVMRLKEYLANN